jgi:DNA repair exonuclease SbcCD ATPase subunit
MFLELKLKNFRQHKDLTVTFENGVVALRGANEAGKTTLLEAIGYAMGGATMLRETLADVVTWGEKETTLKVSLDFQINGVMYRITRGKSGAEIRNTEQILATGQTEVTKYVETLLGCTVKTATQLMLANQQKLRGTLEEDGAAMKLIEQLADFQLIDRIVALIQKHRPCGTTVSVESRIQTLEQQLAEPLVDDTPPFVAAVAAAQTHMDGVGEQYHAAKAVYDALQEPARQAQQRLDHAAACVAAVQLAQTRLSGAKATFDSVKPVPGPDEVEIGRLRAAVTEANRWQDAVKAHAAFVKMPEPQWEGSLESLEAERVKIGQEAAAIAKNMADLRTKIAVLQGQRITQSACGLCGKDLANVPEVVTRSWTTRSRRAKPA